MKDRLREIPLDIRESYFNIRSNLFLNAPTYVRILRKTGTIVAGIAGALAVPAGLYFGGQALESPLMIKAGIIIFTGEVSVAGIGMGIWGICADGYSENISLSSQ